MKTSELLIKDMDLEGFQRFMDIYLEVEMPRELIKRLFLSFVKKTISPVNRISVGKHCVPSQSVPEGTKLLTVSSIIYFKFIHKLFKTFVFAVFVSLYNHSIY